MKVFIDGVTVGHVRQEDTSVIRPLVDKLAVTGQSLVGSALVVGGGGADKKYGVRLQVRPEAAKRWAAGTRPADVP